MDPFAVLGVLPTMALDAGELERRYLELSRASHPDLQRAGSTEEQVAVLERSAQLNDAYRLLVDPWRRAEVLLELRAPGILDATKKLDPAFLMSAMELAEEVAAAGPAADDLRQRLQAAVDDDLAAIGELISRDDWQGAATRLHQARYHRKALTDLD